MSLDYKKQRLFVIAPHPDDEIIGCGGLISRVKRAGGKVVILFLTVGNTQDFSKKRSSTQNERLKEIENVANLLKFDDYHVAFPGDEYHLQLDKLSQKDILDEIERGKSAATLEKFKPTMIAFPSIASYNQDHKAAANAVLAATRPMPNEYKSLQKIVLSYEEPTDVWSFQTHYTPNHFVELDNEDLKLKLAALKLYKSQIRLSGHPRSLETIKILAQLRGIQAGVKLAEGFFCHRFIASI